MPKTPLAGAIRYALTRMKRLRPYLENAFLELDNNSAERSMMPIALGRKNSHDRCQDFGRTLPAAFTTSVDILPMGWCRRSPTMCSCCTTGTFWPKAPSRIFSATRPC
ncbi:MAG: transposase, partial [bacterium]|nr:transposase [bacterium]